MLFTLDDKSLRMLFDDYKDVYGASAYDYAVKAFGGWESGSVSMSYRTVARLLNLIPPYLQFEQKMILFKKVMNRDEVGKIPTEYKSIRMTWDTYYDQLNSVRRAIIKEYQIFEMPSVEFSEPVKDHLCWLFESDMVVAKGIIENELRVRAENGFSNALDAVENIKEKCSTLYNSRMIYDEVSFSIDAVTVKYTLYITPQKKPFGMKLKELFS